MIVDWVENCENIFNTKRLKDEDPSDSKIKRRQEHIYVKYLFETKGFTVNQCCEEWSAITNGTAEAFRGDDLNVLAMFNRMWRRVKKIKYRTVNLTERLKPAVFYQEEIDFLCKLDVPLWVKQYWGALLFYYKFDSQKTARVQKSATLNSWCIRHTDVPTKRYGSVCQDIIAKYRCKLKKEGCEVIIDKIKCACDNYSSYKPAFLKNKGEEVFIANSIDEIDEFLKLINPTTLICPCCGKKFFKAKRIQRTVCEECYKKNRKEYLTIKKRESRAKNKNVNNSDAKPVGE